MILRIIKMMMYDNSSVSRLPTWDQGAPLPPSLERRGSTSRRSGKTRLVALHWHLDQFYSDYLLSYPHGSSLPLDWHTTPSLKCCCWVWHWYHAIYHVSYTTHLLQLSETIIPISMMMWVAWCYSVSPLNRTIIIPRGRC